MFNMHYGGMGFYSYSYHVSLGHINLPEIMRCAFEARLRRTRLEAVRNIRGQEACWQVPESTKPFAWIGAVFDWWLQFLRGNRDVIWWVW